ncbi:MAG: hypothetical protein IJ929_08270 [Prevotella sp.]|nr:hypothetical protein [Prevotella sp.]
MEKRYYENPKVKVIKLKSHFALLAGSNGDSGSGTPADPTPEGGEGD